MRRIAPYKLPYKQKVFVQKKRKQKKCNLFSAAVRRVRVITVCAQQCVLLLLLLLLLVRSVSLSHIKAKQSERESWPAKRQPSRRRRLLLMLLPQPLSSTFPPSFPFQVAVPSPRQEEVLFCCCCNSTTHQHFFASLFNNSKPFRNSKLMSACCCLSPPLPLL